MTAAGADDEGGERLLCGRLGKAIQAHSFIPAPPKPAYPWLMVCTRAAVHTSAAQTTGEGCGSPRPWLKPEAAAFLPEGRRRADGRRAFRYLFAGPCRVTLRTSVTGGAVSSAPFRNSSWSGLKSRMHGAREPHTFRRVALRHEHHRHRGDARPMPAQPFAPETKGTFGVRRGKPPHTPGYQRFGSSRKWIRLPNWGLCALIEGNILPHPRPRN